MNLLPKTTSEFTKIDYWDKFFKKRGLKTFEWYGEYPELCGILHKYIRTRDKILVIGCGNSTLSSDLYNVGYKNIMNIDNSAVVIRQMKAKHKGKQGLEYQKEDATNMNFNDESFTVVLDKGTLDALMPDSSPETLDKINRLFGEVDRVLIPLGRFVCISLLQPHILQHLLEFFSSRGWMVRICRCEEAEKSSEKAEKGGLIFPVFVVICTKLKKSADSKQIFEVSQGEEEIVRMTTLEETATAIKSMQDTALVCSGLKQFSLGDTGEVTVELSRPGDKYPRYTVTVADASNVKGVNNMTYAAFIVPQGREREWLFATPEGRQVLIKSSRFDRVAVIRLHREHKYESLKCTQEETADTIMKLAPNYKGIRPKIPFLSISSDLGNVKEVARGESELSGGFIIEDAEGADNEVFRRLIFLSSQNVVQSDAKLKTVNENGEVRNVIDITYLASEYHKYLTLGVTMVAKEDSPFHVLVIGLGGGGLCTYIRHCFPTVKITALDIDPAILEVATKYFDFMEDDQLQVIIQDGLDYLKTAASKGTKFDAILYDVNCNDSSLGITCPPESFLEPDILQATADCTSDRGIFLVNFVCRVKEIRDKTRPKLEKLYKDISSIKLVLDVNEIFFCWKNKPSISLLDASEKLNKIIKNRNIQENDLINKEELSAMIRLD